MPSKSNETNINTVQDDFVAGDKIVHNHHYSPVIEVDTDPEALWERFRELPTDAVPDRGGIPAGSFFNMPVNLDFVGRERQLAEMAQMVSQEGTASTVAIAATGLGGIGKTQLAAAFCHRYGRFFGGGVYWLNFESEETARTDLTQVAILLNEGWQSLTPDEQITMVLNHADGFSADIPRLLVFDNLEDVQLLRKYKPARGGCRVLLTSRRGNWERARIPGLSTLSLDILEPAESVALIRTLAEHVSEPDGAAIAHELGHLPLALHVAGAYLSFFKNSVPVEKYIGELKDFSVTGQLGQQAADIEEEEAVTPTAHTWHIGRTFRLSYDQLLDGDGGGDGEQAEPANPTNVKWVARRLLSRAAVFAAGAPIPADLLYETFELKFEDEPGDDKSEANPFDRRMGEKGMNLLFRLGLLEPALFNENEQGVVIHRLIADFVQAAGVQTEEDVTLTKQALLFQCGRINKAGFPRELLPYHPHLYHLLDVPETVRDVQSANLFNTFGFNLESMGDLSGAKPYFQQALDIRKEVLGDQHPDTALSLNNMGGLFYAMGDLSRAKPYWQQALDINQTVLGDQHPDTARSLNNMGGLLNAMGDLAGAKPYYQRALDINQAVLGDQHPETARSLNNMGMLLQATGDLPGAMYCLQQALDITRTILGGQHPDTARSLNNMGMLLQATGDLSEAKLYYLGALSIAEQALGEDHPNTNIIRGNLELLG